MIDGHAMILMTIFVNVLSAEDFHLYILLRDFGDNNGERHLSELIGQRSEINGHKSDNL
jgi:hypothetical protein